MFACRFFGLSLVGLIGLTTACSGGATDDPEAALGTSEANLFAPSRVRFEKLFSCDGGAAYVDVNVEERRYLQLVVKDPNILAYLQRSRAASLPFGATDASFRGFTGVKLFDAFGPKINASSPYSGRGVFDASQFTHFIGEYRDLSLIHI